MILCPLLRAKECKNNQWKPEPTEDWIMDPTQNQPTMAVPLEYLKSDV